VARDRQDAVLLRADCRKRAYEGPGLTRGSERTIEQLGMLDGELCSSQNPALACNFPEPSSDGCASESNTSGPDLEIWRMRVWWIFVCRGENSELLVLLAAVLHCLSTLWKCHTTLGPLLFLHSLYILHIFSFTASSLNSVHVPNYRADRPVLVSRSPSFPTFALRHPSHPPSPRILRACGSLHPH
jgi:hypothetical protein